MRRVLVTGEEEANKQRALCRKRQCVLFSWARRTWVEGRVDDLFGLPELGGHCRNLALLVVGEEGLCLLETCAADEEGAVVWRDMSVDCLGSMVGEVLVRVEEGGLGGAGVRTNARKIVMIVTMRCDARLGGSGDLDVPRVGEAQVVPYAAHVCAEIILRGGQLAAAGEGGRHIGREVLGVLWW